MTTRLRLVPALLLAVFLGACDTDSLLDIQPEDEISTEISIIDAASAQAALYGAEDIRRMRGNLTEVRDVSIRYGEPPARAHSRYAFRRVKWRARQLLQRGLPRPERDGPPGLGQDQRRRQSIHPFEHLFKKGRRDVAGHAVQGRDDEHDGGLVAARRLDHPRDVLGGAEVRSAELDDAAFHHISP